VKKLRAMTTFQVEHTAETVQVTLDRNFFNDEELLSILRYLRVEYLAKKINFGEDIEELGEEIKTNWWAKNKLRFIKE
jgi:hypothetical protein